MHLRSTSAHPCLQSGNHIPNPPRSSARSTSPPDLLRSADIVESMYPTNGTAEAKETASKSVPRSASRAHQWGHHRKRRSAFFHKRQRNHHIVVVRQPEAQILSAAGDRHYPGIV